ncbi:MAG TPA: cytochrome c biogenesis protein CcsA [Verrucomicrobiae bacterium]|nr:cytochrome c biogenesis protein CcsA [Verrucomicrobiae bacterium]
MNGDRIFLWLAQVFYATSCVVTLRRLRAAGAGPELQRANYAAMACGFAFHTVFLYLRGHALGRCPLTNLFETQAFITWAAVLFFLLIGPSYRVSFLGAFTAPLVLVICLAALLSPVDVAGSAPPNHSPWIEFHAAIAVLACGAFALAFVTGGMYLFQERQLKTRRLTSSFLLLPSIEQLDVIHFRLLIMGFGMLTVGMAGGIVSYHIVGHWTIPKIIWASSVWTLYGAVVAARGLWALRGRKVAVASMASFTVMLVGFWGVNLLQR